MVRGDGGMDERVTVAEAAERLSLSKEAVRKRISRGTLRSDRDEDGTVRVYVPVSTTASGTRRGDLVEELRDRVRYLERQVEEERDARRRADTLLARMMDRVPELEAPESRETGAHGPSVAEEGRGGPGPAREESERGVQRPWWRRMFGG